MTSPARFLNAMAATVTGVEIVTTDGPAGRFGLTVSSMVSVSADPPLLLVSINRRSPVLAAILENGVFGVSVLGAHHDALADAFAGRPRTGEPYDFGLGHWQPGARGVPLLTDAAAQFECRVSSSVDTGTHAIVFGTVQDACRGIAPPLAYARRRYARPAALPAPVASARVPSVADCLSARTAS